MSYANITPKYQLQSPGPGDVIDPSSELRTKQILDNQMYGAVRAHSLANGIIRSGVLTLVNNNDGTYSVYSIESKSQGQPSIEAFINQIYVYQDSVISWAGLINGNTYYLYINLVENGTTQSSLQFKQVQTSSDTVGNIPSNGLLVAILILNEPSNSVFINNPVGRVNVPILGDHISNNTNPHGSLLNQTNITCSGLNVLVSLNYANLQVNNLIISGNSLISGNITCLGTLIVSGTVINAGNVLYNLLQTQNLTVPGTLWASNLQIASGIGISGNSLFLQNIQLASGVTIGGLDPTLCPPLINGSNCDNLHNHVLGSLAVGVKPIYFSPEYSNTLLSGSFRYNNLSGVFQTQRVYNNNYYTWYAGANGIPAIAVTQIVLPQDFSSIDRIETRAGIGYIGSGSVALAVFDKDLTQCTISPNNGVNTNTTITKNIYNVSGGQFLPEQSMIIQNTLYGASGAGTFLGDMVLWYVPINGEKVVFDWVQSGVGFGPQKYFGGARYVPWNMRIQGYAASQIIGLSGNTVIGVNQSSPGQLPATLFQTTAKPTLNFGANGASFVSQFLTPTENTLISGNTLLTADFDLVASGSYNASLQLFGYRI